MTTRHRYSSTALLLALFAAGCGAEPASNVPNPEVQQDSELADEVDVELSEDDAVEDASDMLDEREIDSDSAELDAIELVDLDTVEASDVQDSDVQDDDVEDEDAFDAELDVIEIEPPLDVDVAEDLDSTLDEWEALEDAETDAEPEVELNACGGTSPLEAQPGTRCGDCGRGTLQCDTPNTLQCAGDSRNACGGCAELEAGPGTACGTCGRDLWACDGADTIACDGNTTDACGGCLNFGPTPGDTCGPCGLDTYECTAAGLECSGATADACGTCEHFDRAVGQICGGCDRGQWLCADAGWACSTFGLECRATKVVVGSYMGCVLLEDSSVWCWGSHIPGAPLTPRKMEDLPAIVDIYINTNLAVAKDMEGSLWAWGRTSDFDSTSQWIFRQYPMEDEVTSFQSGTRGLTENLCATSSTWLRCWEVQPMPEPGEVPYEVNEEFDSEIVHFASGASAYFVIDASDEFWGWGYARSGLLGPPEGAPWSIDEPAAHAHSPLSPGALLTASGGVMAVAEGSKVICWGNTRLGSAGQLNLRCGLTDELEDGGEVHRFHSPVTVLDTAPDGTYAVLEDGTLWAFGSAIPTDNTTVPGAFYGWFEAPAPVQLPTPFLPTQVDAGTGSYCLLSSDGRVWCLGLRDLYDPDLPDPNPRDDREYQNSAGFGLKEAYWVSW